MTKSPRRGLTLPAVALLLSGCSAGGAPYTGPHLSLVCTTAVDMLEANRRVLLTPAEPRF